jgi:molybdopterin adenylyltransferase
MPPRAIGVVQVLNPRGQAGSVLARPAPPVSLPTVESEGRSRAAVVTVSDGVARGTRDDASGRAVAGALEAAGFVVERREVVPDDRAAIEELLRSLAEGGIPLVVTTGGTGLGPRDVTPEATRAVIEREAPGLAEEMRAAGRGSTPFAALSRGLAGSRGTTLVLNLPGSEGGATQSLSAVLPAIPHALDLLGGHTAHDPSSPPTGGRSPDSLEEHVAARLAAGEPVVVATAIRVEGDPPCRVGQKILLGPSGPLAGTLGCAEFDDSAVADGRDVLKAAAPVTRTYRHELGSIEVFLEPFVPLPLLLVFSATPIALYLMRWARAVGFDPVLVEPRLERITPEHRAAGRTQTDLQGLALTADTAAVHTDHDAPGVAESIAALLGSPARFVGVMGSTRHVGPHIRRLQDMGVSQEDVARIRTPVGIDIGARTAEEIALSILAGVVADRRGAAGGWLDRRPHRAGR